MTYGNLLAVQSVQIAVLSLHADQVPFDWQISVPQPVPQTRGSAPLLPQVVQVPPDTAQVWLPQPASPQPRVAPVPVHAVHIPS
jgi:hypothetical protein